MFPLRLGRRAAGGTCAVCGRIVVERDAYMASEAIAVLSIVKNMRMVPLGRRRLLICRDEQWPHGAVSPRIKRRVRVGL
jgi:hypothetical protein